MPLKAKVKIGTFRSRLRLRIKKNAHRQMRRPEASGKEIKATDY